MSRDTGVGHKEEARSPGGLGTISPALDALPPCFPIFRRGFHPLPSNLGVNTAPEEKHKPTACPVPPLTPPPGQRVSDGGSSQAAVACDL